MLFQQLTLITTVDKTIIFALTLEITKIESKQI